MGVPLLLTWLQKRFVSCFTPAESEASASIVNSDNLYVDLNSFLYEAAAVVEGQFTSGGTDQGSRLTTEEVEEMVLQQLYHLLDDVILNLVQPKSLVYLAVDGVSPLGKLAQQRNRRRRQALRQRRQRGSLGRLWDSNCISVGTPFMLHAAQALHHYAVSRTESINQSRLRQKCHPAGPEDVFQPVTLLAMVVDDVLRPGEGETKITEAIRRFRTSPNYNPNTSHVICSSDTDVTVTSLLLHEPRIHVLRYAPPSVTPERNKNAWRSSFFSIHLFREELRHVLGLDMMDDAPLDPASDISTEFEKALHDIVFLLLLFGNDFLPSVSGSIKEGTLDALLTLLAEDFVSRKRYIVDSATNHINFDAARYLLTRLFEIRQEARPQRLTIYASEAADHSGSGPSRGNTNWGFEEEPEHQERRRRSESTIRKECYSYWTMLQWALHYSAGEIQHWSCYYPYERAPPLDKLAEYCGEVSYAALRQFASRQARATEKNSQAEDVELRVTLDPASLRVGERGQPTDVLVQLLVLLPASSKNLLPSLLQQCYDEVEEMVNAPMEKINFDKILAWCEEKKRFLSEAERTRFRAYQLFAQNRCLTYEKPSTTSCDSVVSSGSMGLLARDVVFLALWPAAPTLVEQQNEWERAAAEASAPASASQHHAVPASAGMAKLSSFFGGSTRGRGVSAAAAALRAAPTPAVQLHIKDDSSPPSSSSGSPETDSIAKQVDRITALELPSFQLLLAPMSLLGDDVLQRVIGQVEGGRLRTDHYPAQPDAIAISGSLSRHAGTSDTRLQWCLAVTQEDERVHQLTGLLPGLTLPPEKRRGLQPARETPQHGTLPKRERETETEIETTECDTRTTKEGEVKEMRETLRRRLEALQQPHTSS